MPSATGSEKLWNRHSDRGLNLLWDSLLSLLLLWSTLSVLAAQWGTLAPAALCFCAVLSGGELSELTRLRHTAAEELHTLRYGEAPLSQGSLADAGRLNESDAAVLEVRTEQEKTLYLRAYVGAELSENVWSPLPGEAYGGDYAGMLDWLAEQGFDHQHSAVQYLKRPFHLGGKVHMARRVQQRHTDGAKLQHRLLGKNGDAPLTLHGVRI